MPTTLLVIFRLGNRKESLRRSDLDIQHNVFYKIQFIKLTRLKPPKF